MNLGRFRRKLALGFVLFFSILLVGETGDPSWLTLQRIFSDKEFEAQTLPPTRWRQEGKGYTTVEKSKELPNGEDLVLYDTQTGRRTILVTAGDLTPTGQEKPLAIEDYSWSTDGKKLLVFTNSKRLWRQNTRGDYWVLDLTTRSLKKLGGSLEESRLMFAKFSPDGTKVAYVYRNNIYVEDIAGGEIKPVTADGSETVVNGTGDWVNEEEFGIRDGFTWSPDSRRIAYWQFDTAGVGQFHMINNTDTLFPTIVTIPYPKVGTPNSAVKVGVVSVSGGEPTWMKLEGDPKDHYIVGLEWAAHSEEIIFQRLNRLQNTLWVTLGNAATGETRVVMTEQDEAWVKVVSDLQWLDNGKSFTWASERDGWNHVYLVSRGSGAMKLITPVNFDVIGIAHIDKKGGWLYFTASPDHAGQRYLYRVPLTGTGKAQRLTPAQQPGTHAYDISPDARWAFHTYSGFGNPPRVELIRLPGHRAVRTMVSNDELYKKLKALKSSPVEFFSLDIGNNVLLDGWVMKPYNFDPHKKYPLLFYIYGEPAGQTVLDRWGRSNYLWHLMLTQQGYLVASIDPRGTNGPKGRAWRKSIYKQIGILAPADHAAATQKILNDWKFVDPERIGIWGWSGGGTMTLNQILRYPDLYKTGMAIALVSDQRYYNSIYQERYMALPEINPEGFKNGSPINFVDQLKGNLLLIHGTADDNVHYQNFEVLVNALIRSNKYFTMMSYPNRSHGIYEGENTTRHLFEVLTTYLNRHMPPISQ